MYNKPWLFVWFPCLYVCYLEILGNCGISATWRNLSVSLTCTQVSYSKMTGSLKLVNCVACSQDVGLNMAM